jgi:membrane fusion protein, heavy metal efflux system
MALARNRLFLFAAAAAVLVVAIVLALRPDSPAETQVTTGAPTAEQIEALGVVMGTAEPASHIAVGGLPGEVVAPLAGTARVVTHFAGVVTRLLADEGDTVRAGDPLARIQSREWLAANADVSRARSGAVLARQQALRDRQLLSEGVIPASRAESSDARAAVAEAERAEAEGGLAGLRPAAGGSAGEFDILAPVGGRVLRRAVGPGQSLAPLAELFSISSNDSLEIIAYAPVALRHQLRKGLQLTVDPAGSAEIVAVGADTEMATQSLRIRARLTDGADLLPGQHLQATLMLPAPEGSLRVPTTALLPRGAGYLMYIREDGIFRPVEVEALGGDASFTVIRGAVPPGASIAARGASALQALIPADAR